MTAESRQITAMLRQAARGDEQAEAMLLRELYDELHRLAVRQMRHERRDITLQPTALVHEAYLRLLRGTTLRWQDRSHFFAMASRVMRRILVDHARRRTAAKRGGHINREELQDWIGSNTHDPETILAVDQALSELAEVEPRQARVVELRFFSGMSEEEVSHVLELSIRTIKRDWRLAKVWLYRRLAR